MASEELRFDFTQAPAVTGDAEKVAKEQESEAEPPRTAADELLARIAVVQSAALSKAARKPPTRFASIDSDEEAIDQGASDASEESPVERVAEEDRAYLAVVPDDCSEDGYSEGDAWSEAPEEEAAEESLSIAQFYERVRHALSSAFAEEVWVTGEIRGFKESRGHRYLELADHDAAPNARSGAQQLEVVCWSRDWPTVAAALNVAGVELEVGRVVRVRGKVSVWEGGSKLRFTLTALDVEALLGGIAAARRKLLAMLEVEGLLDLNHQKVVPPVPLRIGIVTSPGTEAHRDFIGQLERSGYAFEVRLEPSLVQGPEAPNQIAAALARLGEFAPDVTVVVRGGGARADLAAFDAEAVARAIATAPFPIWAGIGHTGDRSVADDVANRSLITPTACGEAIVQRVTAYWDETQRRVRTLSSLARARLDTAAHRIASSRTALAGAARHQLDRRSVELEVAGTHAIRLTRSVLVAEQSRITASSRALETAATRALATGENALERRSQLLRAFDPRRQLERGWSLTRTSDGELVRSSRGLTDGAVLSTRFADGEVRSVVRNGQVVDEREVIQ